MHLHVGISDSLQVSVVEPGARRQEEGQRKQRSNICPGGENEGKEREAHLSRLGSLAAHSGTFWKEPQTYCMADLGCAVGPAALPGGQGCALL